MTQKPNEPKIGDKMPDGTIYAGISPVTRQPMYAAPVDAQVSTLFDEAKRYAKELKVGDKQDFRVPSQSELDVLRQNRKKAP